MYLINTSSRHSFNLACVKKMSLAVISFAGSQSSNAQQFLRTLQFPIETEFRAPLGLENLGKWEDIFQSGKSLAIWNRLEKSGKITRNTGKVWEFQKNIIYYFL